MLNNDLSWSSNTDYIISKLNSHFYCVRKLKRFNVDICILKLFYFCSINSEFKREDLTEVIEVIGSSLRTLWIIIFHQLPT